MPSLPRVDAAGPVGGLVRWIELLLSGAQDGVKVIVGVEAVVVKGKLESSIGVIILNNRFSPESNEIKKKYTR